MGWLITMLTTAHSDTALVAAATILGWLWPKFVTEYMERKSMYSFPSTSHALDPWALTRAIWPACECQDWPGVASKWTYWVWSKATSNMGVVKIHDLLVLLGYRALWFPVPVHVKPRRRVSLCAVNMAWSPGHIIMLKHSQKVIEIPVIVFSTAPFA